MRRRRNIAFLRQLAADLNGFAPEVRRDEVGDYVDLRELGYRLSLLRAAEAEADGDGSNQTGTSQDRQNEPRELSPRDEDTPRLEEQ